MSENIGTSWNLNLLKTVQCYNYTEENISSFIKKNVSDVYLSMPMSVLEIKYDEIPGICSHMVRSFDKKAVQA